MFGEYRSYTLSSRGLSNRIQKGSYVYFGGHAGLDPGEIAGRRAARVTACTCIDSRSA